MPHDKENPKWTAEMFARARCGAEVMPPEVLAAFKTKRSRDKPSPKQPLSIRLDRDVVDYFKQTGAGWQSRMNAALRAAMESGD